MKIFLLNVFKYLRQKVSKNDSFQNHEVPYISMRVINKVIIHCTDSPDSLDIDVRDVNRWHLDRGWSGIGYHYFLKRNGTIQIGRPVEKIGAHVRGHNHDSIGVCWAGRNNITTKQYKSLLLLLRGLKSQYKLTVDDFFGHTELDNNKTCPNLDMQKIRAELVFKK